ncbi:ribonuclease HII [Salinibacterium sp. SYSU T00001]|uniref:ribonuclease HII n=1 Tax=Homoserinimonas sedimenticola TaxID=2986805 RepID=UPI0022358858|nr:ribonuclease HII [Salinibacterium sedimenticola]MCW4384848.1 ribonuclease HII [Salinibacterium sedimenticola]
MATASPNLRIERGMHREGARYVIGVDEVGRGAIAGPVGVGMSVVGPRMPRIPEGLRDSKLLTERRREALEPLARSWSLHYAVGLATAEEVDRLGITACLGLAGSRALSSLVEAGVPLEECSVILDGHFDWLTAHSPAPLTVVPRVKADRDCASVSAASVIAKVHRDRMMIDADARIPGYGWSGNKGYGSAAHYAAIDALGPSELHRQTWLRPPSLLDGLEGADDVVSLGAIRGQASVTPS